jgi:hypothetical protein
MTAPKVYADFQNLDDFNRLRLTCAGTLEDLERQGLRLREGLVLTLYTDDADDLGRPDELRAEGVVHYDDDQRCWVAAIDWERLRHASDDEPLGPDRGPSRPSEGPLGRARGPHCPPIMPPVFSSNPPMPPTGGRLLVVSEESGVDREGHGAVIVGEGDRHRLVDELLRELLGRLGVAGVAAIAIEPIAPGLGGVAGRLAGGAAEDVDDVDLEVLADGVQGQDLAEVVLELDLGGHRGQLGLALGLEDLGA